VWVGCHRRRESPGKENNLLCVKVLFLSHGWESEGKESEAAERRRKVNTC